MGKEYTQVTIEERCEIARLLAGILGPPNRSLDKRRVAQGAGVRDALRRPALWIL